MKFFLLRGIYVKKENINGILLCLFEAAVGILLLINPIGFTTGIITAAGIVLLIIGLINVIKYFRADIGEAVMGQYLAKGLIALLAGGFCTLRAHWFIATFPALTIIYGVAVLIAGLGKVQVTCDMIRCKNKKWVVGFISALLSIVCAAVILKNPFATATVLWMFTGITLIVEAVIDVITLILRSSGKAKI